LNARGGRILPPLCRAILDSNIARIILSAQSILTGRAHEVAPLSRSDAVDRLAGKVAIITGAGSGIGRAAAILFASEGAKVAVAELNPDAGAETVRLVQERGGDSFFCQADVTDELSAENAVRSTIKRYGALHVLYNNAGGSSPNDGSVVSASIDEFWRTIQLNLFGTWLFCRVAIPELVKAGGGSVVNTVSNVALMGMRNMSAYSAAKGGVAALTRATAVEFASHGVRVNAIAPSVTRTDRVMRRLETHPAIEALAKQHLVGIGEPLHVAYAALYLASDESGVVTGQILPVDSGVTIS
jgi:NAD(P)-dependent dehydrogenase (short-subunit alcohol dehydrogenase family)